MFRGTPGGSAAGFSGDAGTTKAILTNAIQENLRDGQKPRSREMQ